MSHVHKGTLLKLVPDTLVLSKFFKDTNAQQLIQMTTGATPLIIYEEDITIYIYIYHILYMKRNKVRLHCRINLTILFAGLCSFFMRFEKALPQVRLLFSAGPDAEPAALASKVAKENADLLGCLSGLLCQEFPTLKAAQEETFDEANNIVFLITF